ncbi:MAG: uroporphyrinogen decarboxylase family protein [Atopobiaceae bacterium]|jgi:uroporphyrinogen-III decarboxylase
MEFVAKRCLSASWELMASPQTLGMSWQELYASPENIVRFALAEKNMRKKDFCRLPFCHTLEAEALGARITLGDDTAGTRAGKPMLTSTREVLALTADFAGSPRIRHMLEATRLLSAVHKQVVFCLTGPLSTLSCLVDTRVIFREWRRDPELARAVLAHLAKELAPLAQEACAAGASALEYADPPAAPTLVGPAFAERIWRDYSQGFLAQIVETRPDMPVIVCPLVAPSAREVADQQIMQQVHACCLGRLSQMSVLK